MKHLLIIFCFVTVSSSFGQGSISDSTQFKAIQVKLEGVWKSDHHQFKYNAGSDAGGDYKSSTHSSAPVFRLILKDDKTYIAWMELTGGENLQRVLKISKNKLILVNETGMRIVYRRNKEMP